MTSPAAFPEPYTDVSITFREPFVQTAADPDPLSVTPKVLGEVTSYVKAGTDVDLEDVTQTDAKAQPNSLAKDRDLYANGGAVDSTYLNQQG